VPVEANYELERRIYTPVQGVLKPPLFPKTEETKSKPNRSPNLSPKSQNTENEELRRCLLIGQCAKNQENKVCCGYHIKITIHHVLGTQYRNTSMFFSLRYMSINYSNTKVNKYYIENRILIQLK
jgi:hypothetical protein